MRKYLLSFAVIISFVLYVLFYKTKPSAISSQVQTIAQNIAYKDGTYTGTVENAYYGNVQVEAVVTNGKLSRIAFLQYPNDQRNSIKINSRATVILETEAITSQSANVDIVSGATSTSRAFRKSLSEALSQAQL